MHKKLGMPGNEPLEVNGAKYVRVRGQPTTRVTAYQAIFSAWNIVAYKRQGWPGSGSLDSPLWAKDVAMVVEATDEMMVAIFINNNTWRIP